MEFNLFNLWQNNNKNLSENFDKQTLILHIKLLKFLDICNCFSNFADSVRVV